MNPVKYRSFKIKKSWLGFCKMFCEYGVYALKCGLINNEASPVMLFPLVSKCHYAQKPTKKSNEKKRNKFFIDLNVLVNLLSKSY